MSCWEGNTVTVQISVDSPAVVVSEWWTGLLTNSLLFDQLPAQQSLQRHRKLEFKAVIVSPMWREQLVRGISCPVEGKVATHTVTRRNERGVSDTEY